MATINELKVRNSTKRNLVKNSQRAVQYDFLVKKGVTQDDIGFMSILDVPITSPLTKKTMPLADFLLEVATESIRLQNEVIQARAEVKVLDKKYEVLNKEYQKIIEMGTAQYLQMMLSL